MLGCLLTIRPARDHYPLADSDRAMASQSSLLYFVGNVAL
jgi:hypothetical protein